MLPSARLLTAARVLANLTQEALAAEAGVSASAVKKIERGVTAPTTRTVEKLRVALGNQGVQFVFDPEGQFEGIRRRRTSSPGEPRDNPKKD